MNSNWSYSPETPNLGQILQFLEPCDLEIWRMTMKNNRELLLCYFKLCAWFHCHMWIQTGVKSPETAKLGVDLCDLDLWPWPFAWTSLLSMVITPETFMMIRWWEHGEKGVTDGRTDGQTDGLNQSYSCLVAAKKRYMVVLNDHENHRLQSMLQLFQSPAPNAHLWTSRAYNMYITMVTVNLHQGFHSSLTVLSID